MLFHNGPLPRAVSRTRKAVTCRILAIPVALSEELQGGLVIQAILQEACLQEVCLPLEVSELSSPLSS